MTDIYIHRKKANCVIFTILGEPTGKGRPKFSTANGFMKTYTPDKTLNYETVVRLEYERQCGKHKFAPDAALGMKVTAYKAIPKGTSKKKTALMMDGRFRPAKKPDWDNIGKVVCDALNNVAFSDDNQIVDGRVVKLYGDSPRVVVEIWEETLSG